MIRHIVVRLIVVSFLCVFAFSTQAQMRSAAQPAEIRGQLRFTEGGAPAPDVVVRLDQLAGGFVTEARTDQLGKFKFTNLNPIQYQVIIRHPGFREVQREVNLVMTNSEYLQLQLTVEERVAPTTNTFSAKILDAKVPVEARKEFEKAYVLASTGEKGKMSEGIRHFEKAIEIYPTFLEAKLGLGTTHMDLTQWSQAETVLLRANQDHPHTPNVLFALGELFIQEHKNKEAEAILREGLQLEPRSWQGHFALGRLYWSNNDIVKAGRQVGLALQLNPNFADAHLLAGNILLRAHKQDEAQFEFEEYLRLAPRGKFVSQAKEIVQKIKKARTDKP